MSYHSFAEITNRKYAMSDYEGQKIPLAAPVGVQQMFYENFATALEQEAMSMYYSCERGEDLPWIELEQQEPLDQVEFSKPTLQVHSDIEEVVRQKLTQTAALAFYTADTGLGKSTGFVKAIKSVLWADPENRKRVLILVPTAKLVDETYVNATKLLGKDASVGAWTTHHCPLHYNRPTFTQYAPSMTKAEAAQHDCLIATHAASEFIEKWCGERDVVFFDEDPDLTNDTVVYPSDLRRALEVQQSLFVQDETLVRLLEDVYAWAEAQEPGQKPLDLPASMADL